MKPPPRALSTCSSSNNSFHGVAQLLHLFGLVCVLFWFYWVATFNRPLLFQQDIAWRNSCIDRWHVLFNKCRAVWCNRSPQLKAWLDHFESHLYWKSMKKCISFCKIFVCDSWMMSQPGQVEYPWQKTIFGAATKTKTCQMSTNRK